MHVCVCAKHLRPTVGFRDIENLPYTDTYMNTYKDTYKDTYMNTFKDTCMVLPGYRNWQIQTADWIWPGSSTVL